MKYSVLINVPAIDLQELINNSTCYKEVIIKLGLRAAGGNFSTLHQYIKKHNIDCSILEQNRLARGFVGKRKDLLAEDLFIENCPRSRNSLRRYIIVNNVLEYKCALCRLEPYWNNQNLSLQLDHINGIHNDNRLENLRFLCPNCHSQTENFAGRNCRKPKEPKQRVYTKSQKKEHITWPTDEQLAVLVWKYPRSQLATNFGVSDVAIAKHCKRQGISMPSRGYWRKLQTKTTVARFELA